MNAVVTDDPIVTVARAAALRLTPEYGQWLVADVEATLYAPGSRGAGRDPEQYDWVSLGGLIVAIATLAYTVYADLKKQAPDTRPEVAARTLIVALRSHNDGTPDSDTITEVIVSEIVYGAVDARDH